VTTESDGETTLIGIVSFGRGISCENLDPGVYTRISSFLDWIETNTGIAIQP
jgi:secreted trypsin-like serine protease